MRSPLKSKWQEATRDEFNSLTEMGTWILVSLPKNRNMIKCKWVFMVKANGCYKARVVAKRFTQERGIDYEETFSPVTRYESIHYLLAHATLEDWEIKAMDVKTAYLLSNQQVRSADYLGMQSVTACNDTCIRGD